MHECQWKKETKRMLKRNHSEVETLMENAKFGGNISHTYVSEWKL